MTCEAIEKYRYGLWNTVSKHLKIENVPLKISFQNNCYRQNYREASSFGVEVMNSKVKYMLRENLVTRYKLMFAVCRKRNSK